VVEAKLAKRLVEDAAVAKRFVVVALVPVALPKTKEPVRVVDADVSPPSNAIRVEVAFAGKG
jgi:hypothetical protein